MPITRRTFIKAGAVGTAALVTAGAYQGWRLRASVLDESAALPPAGRQLFAAVLPAFLDGMVPTNAWTPELMASTLDAVEKTVRALPPHARAELRQLFALLDTHPTRFALTGIWSNWSRVDAATAKKFLERWRFGSNVMFASAYQALHDISYGSWYANPANWPSVGYPGPTRILGMVS